jgi:hypothetical protein
MVPHDCHPLVPFRGVLVPRQILGMILPSTGFSVSSLQANEGSERPYARGKEQRVQQVAQTRVKNDCNYGTNVNGSASNDHSSELGSAQQHESRVGSTGGGLVQVHAGIHDAGMSLMPMRGLPCVS